MQQVRIICVGKLNAPFFAAGVAEYEKRLRPHCRFEVVELPEEPLDDRHASGAQVNAALEKEATRILAAVPKGAQLIALCVEGELWSSEQLAQALQQAAVHGEGAVAFCIGSSRGLAPSVKQRAARRISLSRMTLPHQLARLVLTEQIYRAYTIQAGAKYHK